MAGDAVNSASVAGNMMYIWAGNNTYALDASNGNATWSYTTESPVTAVTVDGGFTYVGYNVEKVGNVDCLNSSAGVKIWNYTTEHGHEVTRIVVSDDVIYAITADVLTKPIHIPGSIIYALEPTAVSPTLPLPVIAAVMGIVILAVVFLVCWVRLKGTKGSPPGTATKQP